MSAIDFVVRGDAGVAQRGALAGADGSNSVIVAAGQDLSLNLQRGNILSYVRQGQALQITLMDGRVITVEGFFTPEGVAKADLFISANGELSQVDLVAGDGNLLYAQYIDSDSFGKWSPDDDLYFVRGSEVELAGVVADDSAGMLGTALLGGLGGLPLAGLGAAGLGGALLLGGSSGDGGGDGDGEVKPGGETDAGEGGSGAGETDTDSGEGTTPPVVNFTSGTKGTDHTINGEDHSDGVTVTGTGTPGASGTVTVGSSTKDIVIDGEGNWTVDFTQEEVDGGEYEVEISVTVTNGGGTTTVTDVLVVDTVTTVTFDASTVEGEGTVNFVEEKDGVTLSGTTEEGATVVVTFGGESYNATVTGTTWTLDVAAGVIAGGEYDLEVSVTATDAVGNTATTTDTLRIDTVTTVSVNTSATADSGTVNAEAHAAGVSVTGTAEAGATVVVTVGEVTKTVTATSGGTWSALYSSSEIAEGTYDLAVKAVSTDLAGNTATATGTLHVDTELSVTVDTSSLEGDGIVNAAERADDGITLTGTADAGAMVDVTFGGMTVSVVAGADSTWSAKFPAGAVPEGELTSAVSVKATDSVGNTATANGMVTIDTEISVTIDTENVKTDGVINAAERNEGLTLTGTTDANASVVVTFAGVSRTVTADGSGNWSASWGKGAIPTGETNATVTAVATDAAGNTASAAGTIQIDTLVNRLAANGPVEGDDIVNVAEASDGITLTGVVEAGSKVVVTFEGIAREATVTAAGNWSVTYNASEIRDGEYTANVTIQATDKAGNTATISDTFMVDTVAPDAPDIEDYTDSVAGVKGFSMLETDAHVSVDQITLGGTRVSKDFNESTFDGETSVRFARGDETPDGSHLVVTASDDAGNANSTLFILDDTATNAVNLPAGVLSGYNIGAIDLELAEDTNLTLTVADLKALSKNDDTLIIHGGVDDTVTLTGTATAAGTETINGQDYAIYTLGDDDTRLIINDTINFSTI